MRKIWGSYRSEKTYIQKWRVSYQIRKKDSDKTQNMHYNSLGR